MAAFKEGIGLLPIMWSPDYQARTDVMKWIAAPMIGGVITSAVLNLLIYPVIYVMWRKRQFQKALTFGRSRR
jgi:copper/silver efflux system protein